MDELKELYKNRKRLMETRQTITIDVSLWDWLIGFFKDVSEYAKMNGRDIGIHYYLVLRGGEYLWKNSITDEFLTNRELLEKLFIPYKGGEEYESNSNS